MHVHTEKEANQTNLRLIEAAKEYDALWLDALSLSSWEEESSRRDDLDSRQEIDELYHRAGVKGEHITDEEKEKIKVSILKIKKTARLNYSNTHLEHALKSINDEEKRAFSQATSTEKKIDSSWKAYVSQHTLYENEYENQILLSEEATRQYRKSVRESEKASHQYQEELCQWPLKLETAEYRKMSEAMSNFIIECDPEIFTE